jgi:uncharacterized lipoprotein YmbA
MCVLLCLAGCGQSPNRHVWVLPNLDKVTYYKGPFDPGFTAHIPEYVEWNSVKSGTKN